MVEGRPSRFPRRRRAHGIDIKLLPACTPLNSEQDVVPLRFPGRIFMTYNIPEGSSVTLTGKNTEGQTGSMKMIDEQCQEALQTGLCEKSATYSVSGPQETVCMDGWGQPVSVTSDDI